MRLLRMPMKRSFMLLVVCLILLTVASDTAQAISAFSDNDVDLDSNIDSASNTGSGGNSPITIEQSVVGGAVSSTTVVSASITGAANQLYIAVISSKNYQGASDVSGLTLTWTEIADQCGGRAQTGVSVWWAQGSASTGTVTGTVAASVASVAIQVHRLSGTATSNPIGAFASANVLGVSGGCSGGIDSVSPSVDVSATTNQAMIFGAVAIRSRSLTVGTSFTSLTQNYFGSGGDMVGIATEYKLISPGQSTKVDGMLDSISDWGIVAFEIKAAVSTGYTDAQVQDSTNQVLQESNSDPNAHIEDTIDNEASDIDSAGSIGTLNNFANSQAKDSSYATFNEELGDDYSADMTGARFLVGPSGTGDFRSSTGTIEMWLKFDDLSITRRPWGLGDNMETRTSGGNLFFDFGTDNVLTSTKVFSTNIWYYIAFSWDQGNNNLLLYWGDESTAVSIDSGSNTTWIGAVTSTAFTENNIMASRGVGEVDGHINEFRYWSDVRSLTEIRDDYDTVLTGSETGLQNYYQFENGLNDLAGSLDLTASTSSWAYNTDVPTAITDGYQMDLEVQFTGVLDFMEINTVSLFTGTISAENLVVSYWTGSVWSLLASDLLPNSWNNYTIPVTSSTVTLQFSQAYLATDNSRGSSQLDIILISHEGEGMLDDYVDVQTDLDSYPDKGTISNFNNLKATDSIYNTLTETLQVTNNVINGESFETSLVFSGTGQWARESDRAQDGAWSADYDGDDGSGSLTSTVIDTSTADAIYIDFWWYDGGFDSSDLELRYFDGSTWDVIADFNNINANTGWHQYTETITDSQYLKSNFRVRWAVTSMGSGKSANIDFVFVRTQNYEVDHEVQFSSPVTSLPLTTLSIYTGTVDAEDIKVEYWTGATWTTLLTDLIQNSWNNVTVTDYVTSTFTIRFVDGNRGYDSAASFWQIDSVILSYISGTTHFELEWEHQSTSVDTTKEFYKLTIYGYSSDSTEDFNVQLWNQSSSSWLSAFGETLNNTLGWHNYTIPSGIITSTITWRYTGTVDGEANLYDLNQNTLYVDYAGVASWEEIPVITGNPDDITDYEEGNSPYVLPWTATDSNPTTYTIYRNEVPIVVDQAWTSGGTINYNIDGLGLGIYNFTIVFTDISSNIITDQVDVTVVDTTGPALSTPSDILYEAGNVGNWINWTATDNHDDYYRIFKNETLQTGDVPWVTAISIDYNVDGLLPGIHNFTIAVFDESNNTKVDVVIVIVSDGSAPEIDSPVDFGYESGDSLQVISWTPTDYLPDNYFVYRNGVQVDTGSWSSGVAINYDTSSTFLAPSIYNFTIIIFDDLLNSITDEVIVTIVDTTNPAFTIQPNPIQFTEGSNGNKVDWMATDVNAGTYVILKNGTQVDTNTWSTGVNITYDLDNELWGTYEFVIWIYDTTGNSNSSSVIITVTDETDPTVTDVADVTDYTEGSENNFIMWHTIDSYPGLLTIDRDGTVLYSGIWVNDTDSKILIDGLSKGTYVYTIVVIDQSGNQIIDTVTVTVNDEANPSINTPADFKYPEGSTGNTIVWIGTDLHPGTYEIYRNGSVLVGSGSWVSSGTISLNIDGLTENVYNYTIYIYDTTNNVDTDVIWVEVTAEPVFSNIPSDLYYIVGDTGNSLNWTMIDSNPDTYILYRDGSPINSSTWKNGLPISFNGTFIDGLGIGVYTYRLEINDTDFNTSFDEVTVTVSDMPVFTNEPIDISDYVEGDAGYSLTWNFTDLAPDTYTIYNNSVQVVSSSWTSPGGVNISIDGLTKGTYNYTIIVRDTTGNYIISTITVTVIDQTDPTIDSSPTDIPGYIEGSFTPTLSWDATDLHEGTYTIYQNNTILVGSGSWTNASTIDLYIGGLKKGGYNYTLTIYDSSGNTDMHTVNITVNDETNPIIISSTADYSYFEGTGGNLIIWNSTDLYANNYVIYQNLTIVVGSDTWTNATDITLLVNGLAKGVYNFTIFVYDQSGNVVPNVVWITVLDNTPPAFSEFPSDIPGYIEGTSSPMLIWNSTDLYAANYIIYENDVNVQSGSWTNGDDITRTIGGLSKGTYNFSIIVFDESGNYDTLEIEVIVLDDLPPNVSTPQTDITDYVEGTGGHSLSWEVFDLYPDNYQIYQNLTLLVDSGSWNNAGNISLTINGLSRGVYNFTLYVYDISGNNNSHVVWVTVVDGDSPILTTEPSNNIVFAEGTSGNSLTWVATDIYYDTFIIYENESMVDSGSWVDGNSINYNVDYLVKGLYNLSIIVFDESGNFDTDMLWITVVDDTAPVVNSPIDVQYDEGQTGNSITWIASDNYNDTYIIYNNSNPVGSGVWTSGTIMISVDGLPLGVYFFVIVLNDTSGHEVQNTVIVIVEDVIQPTISTPTDITYAGGVDTGNNITWVATDAYPGTYEVRRDGLLVDSGVWTNGGNIVIDVDGLIRGQFNFEITVYDSSGNLRVDGVIVTVTDTTDPVFSYERLGYTVEAGTEGQVINWTLIDSYPDFYRIYHNDVNIFERGWNSNQINVFPIDDLLVASLGVHNFTIVNFDQSGNLVTTEILVIVEDTILPQFTSEQGDITFAEGSVAPTLTWNISDVSDQVDRNYTIYENGDPIVVDQVWSSGTPIIFTPPSERGTYNYSIFAFDDAGNSNNSSLEIVVYDETLPIFVSQPNNETYDEGTIGHSLSWTMTDLHADTYEIYKDSVLISSIGVDWFSGSAVSIDTDGLSTGEYNYTMVIYDESGNRISSTTLITVIDVKNPIIVIEADLTSYIEGTVDNDLIWNVVDIHPGTYNVTRNGEFLSNSTWSNGLNLTINIDGLVAGEHVFTIFFIDLSNNFDNQTITVTVSDQKLPEVLSITTPIDKTVELGEESYIEWVAVDRHPSAYLVRRDGKLDNDEPTFRGVWSNSSVIKIKIESLEVGFYNYSIEIQDANGNTAYDWIIIRIKDPEVTDTVRPELVIQKYVYEGDLDVINGTWLDVFGKPIVNASITFILYDNARLIEEFYTNSSVTGFYELNFDYSNLPPGEDYYWAVEFSKEKYQTWDDIELDVIILTHTYRVEIEISAELVQGKEYFVAASIFYNNPDLFSNGSLGLNDVTGRNQTEAIGVEVAFTIVVINTDGTNSSYIKFQTSNVRGIAVIRLSPEDTSIIASIISISVKIEKSDNNYGVAVEFDPQKLPEVREGDPSVLAGVVTFVTDNLAFIPIIVLVIALSAFMYTIYNRRKRESIQEINNSVKSAHIELQAIQSIQSIIMQTGSKLTIYEEQVAEGELNSTLISGMVTAFSSFLNEIGKNELFGFEMMEREGVSITLHKGEVSNMIIISQEKLPLVVLSQIRDAQIMIESEFKTNFTNTTRGVTKLTPNQVHPIFHKTAFKIDLKDQLTFNESNIRKMLKQRSLSRALKTNISLLYEFQKSKYIKDNTYTLRDLIRFYQSQGITERVSSRAIILAYQFDVIDSQRNL